MQRAFSEMTDRELRAFVQTRNSATSPYGDLAAKAPLVSSAVLSNGEQAERELLRRAQGNHND